jgi:eukaryotic-like serine/threonine-protein kinase
LVEKDMVTFGCHDNNLYCLRQSNGDLVWKFNTTSEIYANPAVIYGSNNRLLIVSVNCDGVFYFIEVETGQLFSKIDSFSIKKGYFSSPIVFREHIYIGSRDNYLYCFQMTN